MKTSSSSSLATAALAADAPPAQRRLLRTQTRNTPRLTRRMEIRRQHVATCTQDDELYKKNKDHGPILFYDLAHTDAAIRFAFKPDASTSKASSSPAMAPTAMSSASSSAAAGASIRAFPAGQEKPTTNPSPSAPSPAVKLKSRRVDPGQRRPQRLQGHREGRRLRQNLRARLPSPAPRPTSASASAFGTRQREGHSGGEIANAGAIASWTAAALRRFRTSRDLRKAPEGWSTPKRCRVGNAPHACRRLIARPACRCAPSASSPPG
jgi:hypothetical protein